MYLTLKSRTLMKFIAQVILLLLIAFFTIIGTALLIAGTAHAAEVQNGSILYIKQNGKWEMMGLYNDRRACEHAAIIELDLVRSQFKCTKTH